MAIGYGPKIVTAGLVLCLDKYNEKSYLGEPTTNLVHYTGLDTGWSKGYNINIVWNDIDPPDGIDSTVVGFNDAGYPSSEDAQGYWYSYGDHCPQDPSTQYSISLYVKTDVTSNVTVNTYTADNSETGRYWSNALTVTASDGWKRLEWNFTSASNAQSDSLSFYWSGMTGKLWLCAPQMEVNPHATKYIQSNDNGTTTTRSLTDGWRNLISDSNHLDLTTLTYTNTHITGTYNNDFSFDGIDDKVLSDSHSIVSDIRGNFSVGMWLKFGGTPSAHHIPFWISDSNGYGFVYIELGSNYGYLGAATETFAHNGYVSGANINDNNWHYIVVTRSTGSSVNIYKDGVSQTVTTHNMYGGWNTGSGGDLSIGVGMDSGNVYSSSHYTGDSALISVYNRILSAADVLQNFNAHKGRFGL